MGGERSSRAGAVTGNAATSVHLARTLCGLLECREMLLATAGRTVLVLAEGRMLPVVNGHKRVTCSHPLHMSRCQQPPPPRKARGPRRSPAGEHVIRPVGGERWQRAAVCPLRARRWTLTGVMERAETVNCFNSHVQGSPGRIRGHGSDTMMRPLHVCGDEGEGGTRWGFVVKLFAYAMLRVVKMYFR